MKKYIKISFFLILVSLFYGCTTILITPSYEYSKLKPYKYDKKVNFYINKVETQAGSKNINAGLSQLPDEIIFDALKQALKKLGIWVNSPDSAKYIINVRLENFCVQPESGPPTAFKLSFVSFFNEKNTDKNILVLRSKALFSDSGRYLGAIGYKRVIDETLDSVVSSFVDNGIIPIVEKTISVSSSDTVVGEKTIKPLVDITFNHKNLISLSYSFAPWPQPNIIEYDITAKDPYIDSYFQLKTRYGLNEVFESTYEKKDGKHFRASHKFPETAFNKDSESIIITQKTPYVDTCFTSYRTIKYPNFFRTETAFRFGVMLISNDFFGEPLSDSLGDVPVFMEFIFGKVSSKTKIELLSQIAGGQAYGYDSLGGNSTANMRTFYWQEKLKLEAGKKLLPELRILGGVGGEYRWGFQQYKTFGIDEKYNISEFSPFLKTGLVIGRKTTLGYEQHLGTYLQQVIEFAYRDGYRQTDLSLIWNKKMQRAYFGITFFRDPYTAVVSKSSKNSWCCIGTSSITVAVICLVAMDILFSNANMY